MAEETEESNNKLSAFNFKNLTNGVSRMFGAKMDEETTNPRGELWWVGAVSYIAGVSIGTANTKKAGAKRFNLGPVYLW